ncbi:TetR/AcrR family transcriptional regulator [Methanofollis aquaemaris]|uniref:TetR/AcrR family transcriptional regulator n=1 Tax=Methanofollis aquaemaris TaxID=126734 RepID=A0A8A3S4N8_9EURY|nr:TetR/AcrR family transcriptional regulator [Methanofollis aquaemaris]QSZ67022.1 TetR/AcrR family transcriptional regulator [Methanofollis aquaemaris]
MPKVVPEYKDEARRRIIEAAIAEADENGFSNLKMENVASRLGISRATLYLYVKNREELISSALVFIRSWLADILRDTFSRDTFEDTFSAIFDKIIYPGDGTGMNAVLEVYAGAVRDDMLHEAVKENYSVISSTLSGYLEEQKSLGRFSEDLDADLSARIIISIILGIKMGVAAGLSREEAYRIWDAAVRRALA